MKDDLMNNGTFSYAAVFSVSPPCFHQQTDWVWYAYKREMSCLPAIGGILTWRSRCTFLYYCSMVTSVCHTVF